LFTWRRACRQSEYQTADDGFVPAVVVPDVSVCDAGVVGAHRDRAANRRRVIFDGGVDIAALCQLVEALELPWFQCCLAYVFAAERLHGDDTTSAGQGYYRSPVRWRAQPAAVFY
jgi:hypothetical protein